MEMEVEDEDEEVEEEEEEKKDEEKPDESESEVRTHRIPHFASLCLMTISDCPTGQIFSHFERLF